MDYKDMRSGQKPTNFWSRARRSLISAIVQREVTNLWEGNQHDLEILNIGAGIGEELECVKDLGFIHAIDVDTKALSVIPKESCTEKKFGSITSIPYNDGQFDMVLCFDVLEHVEEEAKAIQEVERVLKKQGLFIFTVPSIPMIFSSHDVALGHKRRYTMKRVKSLTCNFSTKLFHWNSILTIPISIMRLIKKGGKASEDVVDFPKAVNTLLYNILLVENKLLLKRITLPFGLSILGICYKQDER
ncbi:MAG: class I SAM-dependent methyltransferase [Promethearchaeota archaeon]